MAESEDYLDNDFSFQIFSWLSFDEQAKMSVYKIVISSRLLFICLRLRMKAGFAEPLHYHKGQGRKRFPDSDFAF